jgi:hypothetical protein
VTEIARAVHFLGASAVGDDGAVFYRLDEGGELLLQRWLGGETTTIATFPDESINALFTTTAGLVAGGLDGSEEVLFNVDATGRLDEWQRVPFTNQLWLSHDGEWIALFRLDAVAAPPLVVIGGGKTQNLRADDRASVIDGLMPDRRALIYHPFGVMESAAGRFRAIPLDGSPERQLPLPGNHAAGPSAVSQDGFIAVTGDHGAEAARLCVHELPVAG